jgi:hypothetical protein
VLVDDGVHASYRSSASGLYARQAGCYAMGVLSAS